MLSLLLLIAAASKSPIRRMAFDSVAQSYVGADTHPDATMPGGVLVAEIDGPLFFADAAEFRTELRRMAQDVGATVVVVDLGATADIDLDGADIISDHLDAHHSRACSNGLAFLVGWMAGLLIVGGIAVVVAKVAGLTGSSGSSSRHRL